MNLKKIIGMFMAVMIILFALLTMSGKTTYAANANYVLGITNVREASNGKQGGAYGIGGLKSDGTPTKKVWKIVSYPTQTSDTIDYSNAFYCMKAEHGFMVQGGNTNVTTVKKTYNLKYDMKSEKQEVLTRLNAIDVFKTDATSYNKIMWIMDNMYLPKADGAEQQKIALLTSAGIIDEDYTIEHARITDDDIEVVQQLALWYFTNNDDSTYNGETLPELYFNNWSGSDSGYKNFEDLYNDPVAGTRDGLFRQQECEMLYTYFLTNAKTKGDYVSKDTTSPLTLDKTRVVLSEEGENYIVGPFRINQNTDLLYTLNKLGFTNESGNTFEYVLLDENKQEITDDITKLYGKDFYIKVKESLGVSTINFDISLTYTKTLATYYTTDEATYRNEQPVVLVEKTPVTYEDKVTLQMPAPKIFDLALRKFISAVNGVQPSISRVPVVDVSGLVAGTSTTATYNHPKAPLPVEVGDIVTYTIRVYNEGEKDGYVSEITDHLPPQLEFLPEDEENIANGWVYDENDTTLRTIKTSHLSLETDTENMIKAFDGNKLDYKDVTVKCKVVAALNYDKRIVNIADITEFTDKNGNTVIDRDSQEDNVLLPTDENLPNYKEEEMNRGDQYILGQQDDDDFDNVRITYFDLALRKFITAVNGKVPNVSREPVVDVSGLVAGTSTTAIYNHPKEPVEVKVGDIVTYTIRVYNEGPKDGYVSEITDHLPPQLEFLPEDKENMAKGWTYDETDKTHRTIKTNYLSKEKNENNLMKAFDGKTLSYKDISVNCKVTADAKYDKRIVNIADITGFTDKNGNTIKDVDSEKDNVVLPSDEELPNYKEKEINRGDKYIPGQEDDDDFDNVKIVYFDLALRKFITKVDNLDINNRYPELRIGEDGNIEYTHTKEPVSVANGNIVTYTIRIYNEGTIDGYAKEITDDLPEGLRFLPQNDTNVTYRWKMIDKDGNETEDVEKAVKITTDYLSKEQEKQAGANLLKAFNKEVGITDANPDHRDVKVAFKVTEPNTSDRILINTAEISEDSDEFDKPVDDIDSTPGNNKEGEDDIDIDKVKVKYFDLALKKWVTQAIVIENGKQTVTETGHTGNENPEPVVKVDLKAKNLKNVTVKFKYKIKVTNEGEIEGYVKEIKDYIPDGLKFDAKDNPKWKQISEKQVTTDQLKDLLLKPGESATVDIILTWENSDKNLGVKVNWAEISKDYNDYDDTPDIDSTPDNNKPGEDDIDNAPVILAIKTGEATIYFGLTSIILVTLAGGIYLIKRFVLS